jgi:hypothetical protein
MTPWMGCGSWLASSWGRERARSVPPGSAVVTTICGRVGRRPPRRSYRVGTNFHSRSARDALLGQRSPRRSRPWLTFPSSPTAPQTRSCGLWHSAGREVLRAGDPRRDHIVAPHITRLHCATPLRSMRASRVDMSTFPDRNNFPLLEDHGRLMECAAHEGLRDVAHDFRPDGSWQRSLAQSLPR